MVKRLTYIRYLSCLGAKSFVVEDGYTDGDYLEDFVSYYSRCFQQYPRVCKRLHFFNDDFCTNDIERAVAGPVGNPLEKQLCTSYLGFIVVRPLPQAIVGRTVLKTYQSRESSRDIAYRRYYPCTRPYKVNLFGIQLKLESSLAFQEQDTVVAACATVALWCSFQKTSELFGVREPRPAVITQVANQVVSVNSSRVFPSKGLNVQQICNAVKQFDLDPEVISLEGNQRSKFLAKSLIYGYMRLGLPVIVGVDIQSKGDHAVTFLGYSILEKHEEFDSCSLSPALKGDRIEKFYAHDDRVGPFSRVLIDEDGRRSEQGNRSALRFRCELNRGINAVAESEIEIWHPRVIIVPAYNKIRVGFISIYNWVKRFHAIFFQFSSGVGLNSNLLEWDIFLTTNNECKSNIRKYLEGERAFARKTLEKILFSQNPKYIWRAQLFYNGNLVVEFLADATDIPKNFPIYEVIWYSESVKELLLSILSSPDSDRHGNEELLTSKFLSFLTSS